MQIIIFSEEFKKRERIPVVVIFPPSSFNSLVNEQNWQISCNCQLPKPKHYGPHNRSHQIDVVPPPLHNPRRRRFQINPHALPHINPRVPPPPPRILRRLSLLISPRTLSLLHSRPPPLPNPVPRRPPRRPPLRRPRQIHLPQITPSLQSRHEARRIHRPLLFPQRPRLPRFLRCLVCFSIGRF